MAAAAGRGCVTAAVASAPSDAADMLAARLLGVPESLNSSIMQIRMHERAAGVGEGGGGGWKDRYELDESGFFYEAVVSSSNGFWCAVKGLGSAKVIFGLRDILEQLCSGTSAPEVEC